MNVRWREELLAALPVDPATARGSGVCLTRGEQRTCRALHVDWHGTPFAVSKFALDCGCRATVENEFSVVQSVGRLPGTVSNCAPEPLGLARLTVGPVAFYSYVPGQPAPVSEVLSNPVYDEAVIQWLLEMHGHACDPRPISADEFERFIDKPARDTLAMSGGDDSHLQAMQRGLEWASGIVGEMAPHVTCHGDLWARNVLFGEHGRNMRVIDWDLGCTDGLPLFDLLQWFTCNVSEHYGIEKPEAAEVCVGSGIAAAVRFRSAFTSYCDRLGWRPANVGAWLVAFIIHRYCVRLSRLTWHWVPTERLRWVFDLPRVFQLGGRLDGDVKAR